jgi:hypothetical protein
MRMRATVVDINGNVSRYDFAPLPPGEYAFIELQPSGKWKLFRESHRVLVSTHAEFSSPNAAKLFIEQKFPAA